MYCSLQVCYTVLKVTLKTQLKYEHIILLIKLLILFNNNNLSRNGPVYSLPVRPFRNIRDVSHFSIHNLNLDVIKIIN